MALPQKCKKEEHEHGTGCPSMASAPCFWAGVAGSTGLHHGRTLCLSLLDGERLHVHGSGAPWGVCVRDGAHRDPLCHRDFTARPSASSWAGEHPKLPRLRLCLPRGKLLAECLGKASRTGRPRHAAPVQAVASVQGRTSLWSCWTPPQ